MDLFTLAAWLSGLLGFCQIQEIIISKLCFDYRLSTLHFSPKPQKNYFFSSVNSNLFSLFNWKMDEIIMMDISYYFILIDDICHSDRGLHIDRVNSSFNIIFLRLIFQTFKEHIN